MSEGFSGTMDEKVLQVEPCDIFLYETKLHRSLEARPPPVAFPLHVCNCESVTHSIMADRGGLFRLHSLLLQQQEIDGVK